MKEDNASFGEIPFEICARVKTEVFTREVCVDPEGLDVPRLKAVLCERADRMVAELGLENQKGLKVVIRPARESDIKTLQERLKSSISLERSR